MPVMPSTVMSGAVAKDDGGWSRAAPAGQHERSEKDHGRAAHRGANELAGVSGGVLPCRFRRVFWIDHHRHVASRTKGFDVIGQAGRAPTVRGWATSPNVPDVILAVEGVRRSRVHAARGHENGTVVVVAVFNRRRFTVPGKETRMGLVNFGHEA